MFFDYAIYMQTQKQQTTDTYNKSAEALRDKFNNMGARVDDIEKGFSYIDKKNPFVFEIGCGNGRDAKEIVKHTSNYLGNDISKELIHIAQEYVPGARFETADVDEYEFPDGIDIVFSFASLLHSDKQAMKTILQRLSKALNDKGIIFISLKRDEYHKKTKEDKFGTRTFYYYNSKLIEELAGDSFKTVYKSEQSLRGQDWFTIILQKV